MLKQNQKGLLIVKIERRKRVGNVWKCVGTLIARAGAITNFYNLERKKIGFLDCSRGQVVTTTLSSTRYEIYKRSFSKPKTINHYYQKRVE